ncbi:MAG: sensor histidine kinase [Gammaproteobacteria bacterium]
MKRARSLKTEIIYRIAVPFVFFVTVESVLSYYVAWHYANDAYDRWLLDSARSLIQEINVEGQDINVNLPPAALEIFKWDDQDKTYFKIISENKGMLAGDSFVPEPLDENTDWSWPVFFNDTIRGERVRVVSMLVRRGDMPDNVFVHVAETINKRDGMVTNILLADLIPQILLLSFTGLYLLRAITRGLHPLRILTDEIRQRSSRDLSPIPENHVLVEVVTLTDTINALFQRLALAIAAQQRFIANAAHQLRTPLAGFKLQAERALREHDIGAMQPALLQMQNSADRMSHLIAQLLVLARSESIEGGQQLMPFDFCALVREVCIAWVPKALQRKMKLGFEGLDEACIINGDHALLRELLANLLDNAITYGRENGKVKVKLAAKPLAVLVVEDDGPGIPPAEKEKVFERFYRLQGSSGSGCGLGLSIVKEIADLHHAQLEIGESQHSVGTRISVTFEKYRP